MSRDTRNALTILVTTPVTPSRPTIDAAVAIAKELNCPFLSRGRKSVARLLRDEGREAALVLGPHEIRLMTDTGSFGFHPNMAALRILALGQGRGDRMVKAMGLERGWRVLDCTCGFGADAVVAAHVAGPTGEVCAVEHSPVLAALVGYRMRTYIHKERSVQRAMHRVRVTAGNSGDVLRAQGDGAWDVVYFDPMFESTIASAQGLDIVRRLGTPSTPSPATIAEARRVARQCVVMKDRAPGDRLERLGIPVVSKAKRVWYGKLEAL